MDQSITPDLEYLHNSVHQALRSWGKLGSSEEELLGNLLLVREKRAEQGGGHSRLELRTATNDVLLEAIEELATQDENEAAVLEARFVEGNMVRQVANRMYASSDQVNRWQRAAIEDLTMILLSRELALRERRRQDLEAMLPAPPYVRLFGFDPARQELVNQLLQSDGSSIVAIVGIGGIGKTSLADFVVRQIVQDVNFSQVAWLQATNRTLSGTILPPEKSYEQLITDLIEALWPDTPGMAIGEHRHSLKRALKAEPHLVIIDNLETEETTAFVLDQIRELADPSKFLVTSRSRPTLSASTYFLSLDELAETDAAELIRFHAATIGLEDLAQASQDEIQGVYRLTGGNPLALKLVVSLAAVLPLPQILSDLAASSPGPVEELYRHIYWEAWRTLSEDARVLLQAMPLVAESGALPEQMQAISRLTKDNFWPAVTELASRSLLEVRGTILERRYGIHRLTETFLRTEIIHWPED